MSKIGVINYGVGNLQSVKNSLDFLGIPNEIVDKSQEISSFDKIILPGVGAFGAAIKKLNDLGFTEEIRKFSSQNKPILGICLGMQLLFDESYEHGHHQGLGLIKGRVLPFNEKIKNLPLPQIGWNNITKVGVSPILKNVEDNSCFYFVHSFYCEPEKKTATIASSDYGIKFAAIINENNIFGCQFHPEKSQSAGLHILKNFSSL
ncbi:MAG: imidazole glycerol phosphate synthase, glutamine amidotransferase subunit [Candidatus Yanofskybacteria bacterium RIFCSPHIGHO2_01_FULL_42_12]|uniref:Imidazole glycerol phosphate synthase subunit HisH n=1 Tax=Candidatus Yanofskybacteria bacterium RIFCSPLOWO2_01_FULL_42_49 TaxID=1802694 RepID=A0A1F8G9W3_9BACT|nr:MAG: imidazole glycerol phosphate synthase, glutamine amidotransferase subunit [Candidatus Yanofskybacteria bacterium RIFCSPHIGHO2_01_FULL_42_12]OGN22155.1 MAG: imidazole glycerol phosphate synthase, glutamine amidotransferase subunit [Candidatus Yanofskybacteria bacterium RIFCSPLOWO2_01_FULL_42_49]